jgi:excisionase family DNA binding protein
VADEKKTLAGTERLLTSKEVAELRGVSVATVCRWARDGKLNPVGPPGSHLRFRESDVRALLSPQQPAA